MMLSIFQLAAGKPQLLSESANIALLQLGEIQLPEACHTNRFDKLLVGKVADMAIIAQ